MSPGILRALSARRSLSVFLAGVVGLASWQVWLTWRLLEQDRNLERQRSRDRLNQIADLAVAQLERSLGDWDLVLSQLKAAPPPSSAFAKLPSGAILILISPGAVKVYPPRPLLFVPDPPAPPAPAARLFEAADILELREQQYDRAIAALQPLANNPTTRPEALLRIARIRRKAGHPGDALDTYHRLDDVTAVSPGGIPYGLLAANARCRMLIELGKRQQAAAEAESLRAGLLAGRWPLRREAFEYHWSELGSLGLKAGEPPQASMDFASLVSALYDRWRIPVRAAGTSVSGRVSRLDSSLLIWNTAPERLAALLAPSDWMNSTVTLPANSSDVRWKLLPAGALAETGAEVTRSLAEAQLPGRLEFSSVAPLAGAAHSRRILWLAGVVLTVVLVLASGYAVHRAISQELRVARLQSDFVAAVSHEFRSPLTTLRTLTELLANNRIPDESRRRQSYQFLDRETNRLHQLVEDLLDFGRMESGRKQYRMEAHDAFHLVRAAVDDVSEGAAAGGFQVETNLGSSSATIQADEEAFRRVVRNLLENAIKYSPVCRTVWVEGQVNDHHVSISVRDHGMGIDPREQRAIFQKFVRGDAAKKAGIKGTGIGLSMAQQILDAFGGEIRLESSVGVGSTFTIVLPLAGE